VLDNFVYSSILKGIKVIIDLGFTYSLIMLVLFYLGLLLACELTSLHATAASLAVVTVITFVVSLIPSIGGIVALISQYIMLKKIDSNGSVIFTMLINIITTFFVLLVFMKMFNKVSFSF